MQLENRTAIVAGGASGLGAATVRRLHAAGATVIIADLDTAGGDALAAELGDRAVFAKTNVTDEASVRAALDLAPGPGGLRVAVNCAGIAIGERTLGRRGPHALESFSKVVTVNLIGTFNVLRLAAAAMAEGEPDDGGERGVIVDTASVAAFEGQIGQVAYAASKGGVAAMTLPAARDLAGLGIRVVTIAPGTFDTPMMAGLNEAAKASLAEAVPFPARLGRPEEYADLVACIIGNPMLNGEVIRLDGALRMASR